MARRDVIKSASNPLVARVRAAQSGKEHGVLVLEGDRLIDDALGARWEFEVVLVSERLERRADELEQSGTPVRVFDHDLLNRISALETSPGTLALVRAPVAVEFGRLHLSPEALLVVVSGVADPGNLGALARSAEAAGVELVCVIAGGANPWNPKALRGSMGSLLRVPVAMFADAAGAAREFSEHGFRNVRAATRGGARSADFDWGGRVALWIGSETGELPAACEAFERVSIPMRAGVESLNVTVAASLLMFAAGRAEDPRP